MMLPIAVESEEAHAAFAAARENDGLVLLVPKVDGRYGKTGTVAQIEESGRLPNGREASVIRGLYRGILNGAASNREGTLWITVEPAPDPKLEDLPGKAVALAKEYRALIENLLDIRDASSMAAMLRGIEHPGVLADMAGYSPDLKPEQLREVLEERDVVARLEMLIRWTRDILAEASLKDKIRSEVNEGLDKHQREFYLRQQLEAIKKELGESDGDVVSEYRKRIEETPFPEDVRNEVDK